MKAHSQDAKSLRKDIYKLRKSLRENIREVGEASKASSLIPTDAVQQMRKLEKQMREKAVSKLNTSELTTLYRKLKYVDNLKSSTLEGAKTTAERWTPIKRNLDSLSQEQRDKWWGIYENLYKYYSGFQNYKYDIFNVIDSNFGTDYNENIVGNIIDAYDEILMNSENMTDAEIMLLFTEKLKELL